MRLVSAPQEDRQSIGPLSPIAELLRRLGINPAEVLADSDLSPTALDNPQSSIPYVSIGPLFEAAAAKSCCPHFALQVGTELRTQYLGIIGQLMRNAPTIGCAILDYVAHQHRNAHGSVAYLLRNQSDAYFGYAVYQPGVRGHRFICDWVAAGGMSVLRELAGATLRKNTVEILLSRPAPADPRPYERAFGTRMYFDREQTAIRLPLQLLECPIKGSDALLRKQLEQRIRTVWLAGHLDPATELRRLVRVAILRGSVSDDEIALQMNMSRRTLHRRLSAAGTRFKERVSEVRCGFAKQLLSDTRLTVGEIAGLVGYADPSIFTRSFRRAIGVAPSQWRTSLPCSLDHATEVTG